MPDEPSVQPQDGQGATGTSEPPYAEYLNRIPEEVRGQVEPIFREWDANTTRRFQEASEWRQKWEPYEPLGLTEHAPDDVAWALQFRQAALQNPEAVKEWYADYAREHNLSVAEATQQVLQQQDDLGFADPTAEALKEQLGPIQQQLEQINRWRQQQEEQQRVGEARRHVDTQMDSLKEKHPEEWNQGAVERLVAQYIETDPQHAVQRAFADWQAILSQIQRETLQSKADQPAPAEGGGMVNATPEEPKTMAEANRMALERLRQARSA